MLAVLVAMVGEVLVEAQEVLLLLELQILVVAVVAVEEVALEVLEALV
jgi:hypothetical protein